MKKRWLLLDIDGVVLDWNQGFKKFLDKKGITYNGECPENWSMRSWINTNDSIKDLILEFNNTEDFGKLLPLKNAVMLLKKLNKYYAIVAITSCGGRKDLRVQNLKDLFGENFFHDIHCLDLGESKRSYLEKYPSGVWIEDNTDNWKMGLEVGHKSILFHAYHNRNFKHENLVRLLTWGDVWNLLYLVAKRGD